ncbi:TolC family protein, partial [Acinetobacter baumannii]
LAMAVAPATAETLREALAKAYATNPTLAGARADLRATDENVPIAKSNGLPQVTLQSAYQENVLVASNSFASPLRQVTAQAQATLP